MIIKILKYHYMICTTDIDYLAVERFSEVIFDTSKEMRSVIQGRRSRLDIYLDVLWAIKNGLQNKEDIIGATRTKLSILNGVVDSLMSLGLIQEIRTLHWESKSVNTSYDFTEKGERVMDYLKYYDEVLEELDPRDLHRDEDMRVR